LFHVGLTISIIAIVIVIRLQLRHRLLLILNDSSGTAVWWYRDN
jgi:hypothetical protein